MLLLIHDGKDLFNIWIKDEGELISRYFILDLMQAEIVQDWKIRA